MQDYILWPTWSSNRIKTVSVQNIVGHRTVWLQFWSRNFKFIFLNPTVEARISVPVYGITITYLETLSQAMSKALALNIGQTLQILSDSLRPTVFAWTFEKAFLHLGHAT